MKLKFTLILLIACIALAGCSNGSKIDNMGPVASKLTDEELDMLFESALPGPALPPANIPDETISSDYTSRGLLRICYKNDTGAKLKLQVLLGDNNVVYNLKGDSGIEDFSLQYGNGKYTARIMQNIKGDEYFAVKSNSFNVTLADQRSVFLNSIQNVNWNYEMAPIKDVRHILAGALTDTRTSDLQDFCVSAIYDYIINNIKYDQYKFASLSNDYLPDIESTFSENEGICYDYSSLFAAMLRSISIPAKLVKGYAAYSPDSYHAWNEVFVGGKWVVIDTTRDATLLGSLTPFNMEKNNSDYTKVYEY